MEESKRRCTRFKDSNNELIYEWDVVHVEECPGELAPGTYDYIGVVELEYGYSGKPYWAVVYYDIGEREPVALKRFPINGRTIIKDQEEIEYQMKLLRNDRFMRDYYETE